jgi:signal transduction histidine kinase
VRFWVENEARQQDAEQLSHLFKKFRRGEDHGGEDRRAGGAGLGLYYVRTVARKHGGQVGAECAGGKIRFWVEFPQAMAAA